MQPRRRCLASVFTSLLAVSACGPAPTEPQAGRPGREPPPAARNVVLISLDTLRPDHLGYNGYARPTSPYLDQLARSGLCFDNAISQSPWTLPSHAALFASEYPSSLGEGPWERPERIPAEALLLAEVLAEAGLRTRAFVNGGFLSAEFGLDQGFERWTELEQGSNTFELTVTRALRWLDHQLQPGERFFLFLHTYDIHEYQPAPEAAALLVRPYDGPLAALSSPLKVVAQERAFDRLGALPELRPADLDYLVDLYDATILAADRQLERFWTGLEQRGLARETLLVISSDHGEEFLEHGGTGHGYTLFDENLRVPLLLVHPSLEAARVAHQVRSIDVAPTVVELLGLTAPAPWRGRSLLEVSADRPAFSEQAHVAFVALRSGELKLIRGTEGLELYDLGADPAERDDRAGTGHPREAELAAALAEWTEAHGAWPPPGPAFPDELDPELLDELRRLGYLGED